MAPGILRDRHGRPFLFQAAPLAFDPLLLPGGKLARFAHRAPPRHRDTNHTVVSHRHDVTAGPRMTDEQNTWRFERFERFERCWRFNGF
jgi:hypothetical protein